MTDHNNIIPFEHSAGYWVRRAHGRQNRARPEDSSVFLRQAYRQTHDASIALELAEAHCSMGDYAAARRLAEDLLLKDPDCAGAYYILGLVSLAYDDERLADEALATCLIKDQQGEYAEKAQDLLNDYCWRQDPVFPRSARAETLHMQALDAFWAGQNELAEKKLRKAVRSKKRPQAETLLGEMLLRQGKAGEALRLFQEAVRKLPGRVTQKLLLSQALCAGGWFTLASGWLKKVLPECESIPELTLAAESCLYAGCADLAIRRIREVQKLLPLSNDLKYLLAAIYADTGEYDRALRCLLTVLRRDPDDRDAKAAFRVIGLGPVPLDRSPAAPFVYELCGRPKVSGDAALKRLAHGLTISLGGAMSWETVYKLTKDVWNHLNPVQKKCCDLSRMHCWPNAFYLWLKDRCADPYLQQYSPLHPLFRSKKRVRRMLRYLQKVESWRRIK